jgi:hypothetical protein
MVTFITTAVRTSNPTNKFQFARIELSFVHIVQTGSEPHSASYPMRTSGTFHGDKVAEREAEHSPPTSAEVKETWIYSYNPPYIFMA